MELNDKIVVKCILLLVNLIFREYFLPWATQKPFVKSNSQTAEMLLKQLSGGSDDLHSSQQQFVSLQQQKLSFVPNGQPCSGVLGIKYLLVACKSSSVS